MSITIRGNTKINSKVSVGSYIQPSPTPTPTITPTNTPTPTITPTNTPTPTITPTPTRTPQPAGTFSFTFNQEYASAIVTVTSIGGFTSTPSFTPTSNAFTFNSTGSPLGTTTFSFEATSGNIAITLTTDLIQNSVVVESLSDNIANGHTFIFSPIVVSQNDTIQIRTYFSD